MVENAEVPRIDSEVIPVDSETFAEYHCHRCRGTWFIEIKEKTRPLSICCPLCGAVLVMFVNMSMAEA